MSEPKTQEDLDRMWSDLCVMLRARSPFRAFPEDVGTPEERAQYAGFIEQFLRDCAAPTQDRVTMASNLIFGTLAAATEDVNEKKRYDPIETIMALFSALMVRGFQECPCPRCKATGQAVH